MTEEMQLMAESQALYRFELTAAQPKSNSDSL